MDKKRLDVQTSGVIMVLQLEERSCLGFVVSWVEQVLPDVAKFAVHSYLE